MHADSALDYVRNADVTYTCDVGHGTRSLKQLNIATVQRCTLWMYSDCHAGTKKTRMELEDEEEDRYHTAHNCNGICRCS